MKIQIMSKDFEKLLELALLHQEKPANVKDWARTLAHDVSRLTD